MRWYLGIVFICISLIIKSVKRVYSWTCWLFVYLLWRKVCLGLLLIFWLSCLFFVIELFIYFGYQPLVGHIICKYLSHSIGLLFILFMNSFAAQKVLRLIMSHLLFFAFISFALGYWYKKTLLWFMSENVFLVSYEFYGVTSYILSLQAILTLFLCMV